MEACSLTVLPVLILVINSMGCAPSSSHRQIGLRTDPFHGAVMPMTHVGNTNLDTWAIPTFHGDYRPPVNLSAFISSSVPPGGGPCDDELPPYTEQALVGHVTLMYGTKTSKDKDPEGQEDPDSTLLTARDVSVLDRSTDNTGLENHEDDQYPGQVEHVHSQAENSLLVSGVQTVSQNHNSAIHQSTGTLRCPINPITGGSDPFLNYPATLTRPPPLLPVQPPFQRSLSLGNTLVDTMPRTQPIASPVLSPSPFPLRPPPLASLQVQSDSGGIILDREQVLNAGNHFSSGPTRLPPLQSVDRPATQRKKGKRRRGHSWHGQTLPINGTALSPGATMTALAE